MRAPPKKEVTLHEIAGGFLVEEDGVLAWHIQWDRIERIWKLCKFCEVGGLRYVDKSIAVSDLVQFIQLSLYERDL
jgi:hypothetical protein